MKKKIGERIMLLEDKELNKLTKELSDLLMPKQIEKIISHMSSIHNSVSDLRKSRDNLKKKFQDLKKQYPY